MDVAIKGRNIPVTEALERYAREKVERVAKFFDDGGSASRVEVELLHERNPAIGQPEVADATLFVGGTVMKAREASADMYASIDLMADKLIRQVRRYRGRQIDRWQGQRARKTAADAPPSGAEAVDEEEAVTDLGARIVRTKQFQMKPMGPEEAAMHMELLDHDFFVFTSAETGDINVLYRRRDGDFGLIEPAR
ncbi:ribosome-associated translation inhibitor RaiA [Rubrobacter marinus]|uniref:Ribosome hibernation promoting factor n=1 Tax=Rubrobacter marinus TaxID=2653852 RepID=A0A6G8PWZ1_9ACTN|nr:ribosome-associated translation inhibitor RaiA [Rubrobacter marinus]QIN78734.1 ribosome-associated translation inhibitor RaiA [Rubrobacter marinus]